MIRCAAREFLIVTASRHCHPPLSEDEYKIANFKVKPGRFRPGKLDLMSLAADCNTCYILSP